MSGGRIAALMGVLAIVAIGLYAALYGTTLPRIAAGRSDPAAAPATQDEAMQKMAGNINRSCLKGIKARIEAVDDAASRARLEKAFARYCRCTADRLSERFTPDDLAAYTRDSANHPKGVEIGAIVDRCGESLRADLGRGK